MKTYQLLRRLGWVALVGLGVGCGVGADEFDEPVTGEPFRLVTEQDKLDAGADTTCYSSQIIGQLGASPTTVVAGGSTTLSWRASIPIQCQYIYGSNLTLNGTPLQFGGGTMVVTPPYTTRYVLKMGTLFLAEVTVSVNFGPVFVVQGNTFEWALKLKSAAAFPNTTIVLPEGLSLNMWGLYVPVASGVRILSQAANQPNGVNIRNAHNPGPLIYSSAHGTPLFEILGDNVSMSGFRLGGPHWGSSEGNDHLEQGIRINGATNIDIFNMELYGWGGQAIYIKDADGEDRQTNFSAIRIYNNFFHHNQHVGRDGYGIEVKHGGKATVERNVFDFNRHALASGSEPGTGYLARFNLVLKGGGYHDTYLIYSYYTHQFDVHGNRACDVSLWFDYDQGCGNAGEAFEFLNNAFQYTAGNAIKVRGIPSVSPKVYNNVFAHGNLYNDAVVQNGLVKRETGNTISYLGNRINIQTYGKYGVCDFDGDGTDDLFLPTGVSWWYSSGGRMHWSPLRTGDTELLSQLRLGDFDGDGRCDVLRVQGSQLQISKRGVSNWTTLPGSYPYTIDQLAVGFFIGNDRASEIFVREGSGQWLAISFFTKDSAGNPSRVYLQNSQAALSALRFGDFDGNGVTDVLRASSGNWNVSWDARQPWAVLNSAHTSNVQSLLIGNVDGYPGDDVVRYLPSYDPTTSNDTGGTYEISSGGRGSTRLTKVAWPPGVAFIGQFDRGTAAADLLIVDGSRMGHIFRPGSGVTAHSLYAY